MNFVLSFGKLSNNFLSTIVFRNIEINSKFKIEKNQLKDTQIWEKAHIYAIFVKLDSCSMQNRQKTKNECKKTQLVLCYFPYFGKSSNLIVHFSHFFYFCAKKIICLQF